MVPARTHRYGAAMAANAVRGTETPPLVGPVGGVALETCPDCGASDFLVVTDWYRADFLCASCHAQWRVQHGWVFRMAPPS